LRLLDGYPGPERSNANDKYDSPMIAPFSTIYKVSLLFDLFDGFIEQFCEIFVSFFPFLKASWFAKVPSCYTPLEFDECMIYGLGRFGV